MKLENVIQGLYSAVVANKLTGEQETQYFSPNLVLTVSRNKASLIADRTLKDAVGTTKLDGWCELMRLEENCSSNETVDMKVRYDKLLLKGRYIVIQH